MSSSNIVIHRVQCRAVILGRRFSVRKFRATELRSQKVEQYLAHGYSTTVCLVDAEIWLVNRCRLSKQLYDSSTLYYRACITNWRFLKLNSWPDCVSRDIARHGPNSDFWFTRKILDLFILKSIFSLLNCICIPVIIIIYTTPPI